MLVEERAIQMLTKYPRLINSMDLKRSPDFFLVEGEVQKAVIEVAKWIENAELEDIDTDNDVELFTYVDEMLRANKKYEDSLT